MILRIFAGIALLATAVWGQPTCRYTLTQFPVTGTPVLVYRNGWLLTEGKDYTRPAGTLRSFFITYWLAEDKFSYIYTRQTNNQLARETAQCVGINPDTNFIRINRIGDLMDIAISPDWSTRTLVVNNSLVPYRVDPPAGPGPCPLGDQGRVLQQWAADNQYFYFCAGTIPYVWARIPLQTTW